MRRRLAACTGIVLLLSSCMTRQADIAGYASPSQAREVIIRRIEYDERGKPLFTRTLKERPSRPGETYTIVLVQSNRPTASFDLIITEEKPDLKRPLRTFYEWTGKGFQWGTETAGRMFLGSLQTGEGAATPKELGAALAVSAVVPVTIGTVTGFIVGLAEGAVQAVQESGKVILPGHEIIMTRTRYEHDGRGRLSRMRMLAAPSDREIVRTEFFYEGSETEPFRTVIENFVEDTIRVIQ